MTNINEVMDRLSENVATAEKWGLISETHADLKALLSYTKQCREAFEQIEWLSECSYAVRTATQALSTQPGGRE